MSDPEDTPAETPEQETLRLLRFIAVSAKSTAVSAKSTRDAALVIMWFIVIPVLLGVAYGLIQWAESRM
jgi:hypothetical protein